MCISKLSRVSPTVFTASNAVAKQRHHHPHLVVQHHYHDHANEAPPTSSNFECLIQSGANTAFPIKLYDMLQRVQEEGHDDVVSWQPHGRCFVVHKPDEFKDLLPLYFTLSKVASFQRQLNLYGFQRITKGADRGGYYHELFLRTKPFLIQRMHRVKVKGTGVRARSNPDQEPDFWAMPFLGESDSIPLVTPEMSPVSSRMHSGHGSVVSNEDEADDWQEDIDLEPLPISYPSLVEDHVLRGDVDEGDLVLTGWGMPFHYLGSSDVPEVQRRRATPDHFEPRLSSSGARTHLPLVEDESSDALVVNDFLFSLLESPDDSLPEFTAK